TGNSPAADTYVVKATTKLKGITGLRIDVVPHGSLPNKGPGRYSTGNFVLTELDAQIDKGAGPTTRPIAFQAASASFEQTSGAEPPRPGPAISDKKTPADIAKILDTPAEKRTKEQSDLLAAHYRTIAPLLAPIREELAKLTAEREELTGPGRMTKYNQDKPR